MGAAEQEPRLRELAERYGVRYEVLPEMHVVGGDLVRVGFEVQLYGLPEHGSGGIPGCPECAHVFAVLKEIAEWSLPREEGPAHFEIQGYDAALQVAPDEKTRDEVRLEMKLVHREDFFAPVDPTQERRLEDLEEQLGRLGIQRGTQRAGEA